jgi:hypothetical protein
MPLLLAAAALALLSCGLLQTRNDVTLTFFRWMDVAPPSPIVTIWYLGMTLLVVIALPALMIILVGYWLRRHGQTREWTIRGLLGFCYLMVFLALQAYIAFLWTEENPLPPPLSLLNVLGTVALISSQVIVPLIVVAVTIRWILRRRTRSRHN